MRAKRLIDLGDCIYVEIDRGFNLDLAKQRLMISVVLKDGKIVHTDSFRQVFLVSSATGMLVDFPGGYDRIHYGPVARLKLYFDMSPGVENNSIYSRVISDSA
jgi:hypothetical protein